MGLFALGALGSVVALGGLDRASLAIAQDACASARLLTSVGAPLPRDGFALVVHDVRETPGPFALVRGRRRTALEATPIAPGLVRIAGAVRPGTYRLEGASASSDVVVSARAPRPAPAAAPSVRSIRRLARTTLGVGETSEELHVELAFPVPAGSVVGRVVGEGAAAGAADVGVWASVVPGQSTFVVPLAPRCATPGWSVPSEGARAHVVFIDALGQSSAPSELVAVQ